MNSKSQELIQRAYTAFNSRDIKTALSTMSHDVQWPKAFEGGYVVGHEQISDYWTRQWTEINPHVEPIAIVEKATGKIQVTVHQVVMDMEGNKIFDGNVNHIYHLQEPDGLLCKMDIELV